MAFYTGKGDEGTSTLFDGKGERLTKSSRVFEALGQLDELNSVIGWCKVACGDFVALDTPARDVLLDVQNHLFTLQAEVAGADKRIPQDDVAQMSVLIENIEATLPEVTSFLLAGGTELSARLDIARTVARRAERALVVLHESGERLISDSARAYANRLSSLLYALIRLENHICGVTEQSPVYQ